MRYLPLFIDTCGRKALVVGGGRAAAIKIKTLLKTELTVEVYAREICEEITSLESDRLILHPGHEAGEDLPLTEADLLIIAFSGPGADALRAKADSLGLWTLRCDSPGGGDFHLGMSYTREPVTVAAHTGGLGPTVGRAIAKDLQASVDAIDLERFRQLGRIRRHLIDSGLHGKALSDKMELLLTLPVDELRALEESYEY